MKTTKTKKKWSLNNYKTYDTSEGFGSPDQWRSEFFQRLGFEEAKRILKNKSPYDVIGVSRTASKKEAQKIYDSQLKELRTAVVPDSEEGDPSLLNFTHLFTFSPPEPAPMRLI